MEPFGTTKFFFCCLIRIIIEEERHHVVLSLLLWNEAVVILPVVLVHTEHEWSLVHIAHLPLVVDPLVLLMLQVHGILVRQPLVVAKETTSGQSCNFWRWLSPHQVLILLVRHHFGNGIRKEVRWQVSQTCVVAHAEATHDSVLLLVREVVQ